MDKKPWHGPKWPKGVPYEISGFAEKPLYSILDESARKYPNQTYTIFNGAKRTFAQVKDTADRIANFLAAKGIKKTDRVAIFLPNLPHYPSIFFGILKAGAVCVTCNPLYTADELNYQLKDSGAKAVFVMDHPEFYPTAVKAIQKTSVDLVVLCGVKSYLPPLKGFLGGLLGKIPKAGKYESGHYFFDQIIAGAKPEPPKVGISPDQDLALVIYTGGTTGFPKGAALKHSNFLHNVNAMLEWMRLPDPKTGEIKAVERGGANCFLGVLPWYHSFGMTIVMLGACASGNRLVCVPDPRAGDPPFTETMKMVQKYKVTLMAGVPTIYSAFTNHPLVDQFDLSSIRACLSGGAPLPVELAKKFEEKTGAILFEGYGLSETSPIACANPANIENRKFGSVGFPFPNTEIKILDIETGTEEQPQGTDGEIAIHGPQVMKEYWNNSEANLEVFKEFEGKRFFLSGDIGHIDEEGYIIITDRKKDMILVGGFNCYPREVEEVLYSHPKVANAAVIGLPHSKSGESVKAYVQLVGGKTMSEKELMDFCKEKLAGYKRPRSIEFREELPTSVVGKVLRRVLKDEALAKMK